MLVEKDAFAVGRLRIYLVVICVVLSTSVALAQGRGGRGDRGGFGGGGFGGRGGQPQDRSAMMEEMLKRQDSNGDGMLDENELSNGPGRFMVERVFGQMGIQPTYPIAISSLKQTLENAFQAGGRSFQGGRGGGSFQGGRGGGSFQGGRGGGSFQGGGGQRPPRNGPPGSAIANAPSPGGLGFGVTNPSQPTTLGFGIASDSAKPTTTPGAASPGGADQIRSLAEAIVRKFDKSSDSRLDKDEWPAAGKWGTFAEANRSGGASVGVPELIVYLTDLSRSGKLSSLDLPDAGSPSGASDPAMPPRPKSGRFRTAKELLPSGLPDWFLRIADDDGQVPMAEYAETWTPDQAARFFQYDLNHDGVITAAECLKAEKPRPNSR